MNARSSIGPGELTLAIKEYNLECNEAEALNILKKSKAKVVDIIRCKCMLPVFKNVKELELFQKQINSQINT